MTTTVQAGSPEFSLDAARLAADEAIARIDHNTDPAWKDLADAAIALVALRLPEFTADDVWDLGDLPPTHDNRALGPRMKSACAKGIIRRTDRVAPSRRVASHGSPSWLWESRVYDMN